MVVSHLVQYPLHLCRSLLHDGGDLFHHNAVTARAAPCRAVNDDRQRGVRKTDFFRQHGFGHARHADDVGAVAFQPVDFGRRFEPRALRCSIDSPIHYRFPRARCCLDAGLTQFGRIRQREIDVVDAAVAQRKKSRRPAVRVIDDLVGNHQYAWREIGADAADGRERENFFHAARLQRPDIGAVIDLVRRYGVAIAMPRQEHDRLPRQSAECQRARGLAVRGARNFAALEHKARNIREAAAPDDG